LLGFLKFLGKRKTNIHIILSIKEKRKKMQFFIILL